MSATYNWAYRPGVTNKYGFTVPAGADNVRPTGWCYVALFGNDTTGNGSRQYPFKTITKAASLGNIHIVIGSGVYRESSTISSFSWSSSNSLIGDGDVVIDISFITNLYSGTIFEGTICNLRIKGNGVGCKVVTGDMRYVQLYDVVFDNVGTSISNFWPDLTQNCIFINIGNQNFQSSERTVKMLNNTFINCNNITLNAFSGYTLSASIFYNCNISGNACGAVIEYSCFYGINWKLNGTANGGSLYPSIPSGYLYYSTINNLQSAHLSLFGTNGFNGCIVSDPLFNNFNIGDYSLSFSSPAKNLSYFGTYAGAKSIGYPIKANATESTGSFDFSTNVNLSVNNDSITLVDPTQNGSIKTKMIINSAGRQIQRFPIYGYNSDRNGQYIDSISDLDTTVKNAGDILTIPASYIVETGAITYNSAIYQVGDRLTTVSGQTIFTTSTSGTLREILEAPERHTIMARFSDGGNSVNAGDALIPGYWYYVVTGNVTYNSVAYNTGDGFKAVDTSAFTGSGSVILALSTELFQHYEPGIQPTSNNTGDTRTGSIIRGNGDPAYVRGGYGVQEFPINAKFIQLYYIINVANLKP